MAAHLPTALVTLARRQHHCFTSTQAADHGVDRRVLRRLVSRQLLVQRFTSVFGLPGDDSWEHHLQAALLRHPGAIPSHDSAGVLQRMAAVRPFPISLIVPAGSNPSPSRLVLHRIGPVTDHHLVEIDGFTTTTIERTLCDLAGSLSPSRLSFILDDLLASRSTTLTDVAATLGELAKPGRPGGPALTRLLDGRTGRPVTGTRLERMLDRAIDGASLPRAIQEYPLPTDGSLNGFVDRAFPEALLIIEADGRRWHSRVADLAHDRARDRRAAAQGWQTVRILYEELVADPDGVAADLSAVFTRRIRQLRSAS